MRYFDLMTKEYHAIMFNFKSNDDILDDSFRDFLIYNAVLDKEKGIGTTQLFIDEDEKTNIKTILGFYTLRCSSLIIGSKDNDKLGEPALEIAEFAVHKDYERTGIGTIMMENIIATSIELNNTIIGVKHLVLCSVIDAINFYKTKFKFKEIDGCEIIPKELRNVDCLSMSVRVPIIQHTESL